jgi:quercetin dioxygenase-like cupin family protein
MKAIKITVVGALLGALCAAATQAAAQGGMTPAEAIAFQPYAPGMPIEIAVLWGDRDQGAYGMLVKLPPGFQVGSHAHTSDYYGMNIRGTWVHTMNGATEELPPGSYVMQPGGQFHDDACKGPEGCVLLIIQNAKGDFIPAPK